MEADSIVVLTLPTAGYTRSAEDSLAKLLDDLCGCAALALELVKDANAVEAQFADVIYTRACDMARALGYRLALQPEGHFIPVLLPDEPADELERRLR